MIRMVLGSVAAAVTMFILALVFFASPLRGIAFANATDQQTANVQTALAQNLPHTGTYVVPNYESQQGALLYARGPIAVVHYQSTGASPASGATTVSGFLVDLLTALAIGFALFTISGRVTDFASRAQVAILLAVGAALYMHIADAVWFHQDWAYAVYAFIADAATLSAGGVVIARWFLPGGPDRAA